MDRNLKTLILASALSGVLMSTPLEASPSSDLQTLGEIAILHPLWARGTRDRVEGMSFGLTRIARDIPISSSSVVRRSRMHVVDPIDSVENVQVSVPWRDSSLSMSSLHLLENYVLARGLRLTNERGTLSVETAFVPIRLLGAIGDLLDGTMERPQATEAAAIDEETPLVLIGVRIETAPIEHPDKPERAFLSSIDAKHVDVWLRSSGEAGSGVEIAKLDIQEARSDATFSGKARARVRRAFFDVSGDLSAFRPGNLLRRLDADKSSNTNEGEDKAAEASEIGPASFSGFIEGLEIEVSAQRLRDVDAPLTKSLLFLERVETSGSMGTDGLFSMDAAIAHFRASPNILTGTPAEDAAERIALSTQPGMHFNPFLRFSGRLSVQVEPGMTLSVSGSSDFDGVLQADGSLRASIPAGTLSTIRRGGLRSGLDAIFGSSVSGAVLSVRDTGIGRLLQSVDATPTSALAEGVARLTGTSGSSGMVAMATQMAVAQMGSITGVFEEHGSLSMKLESPAPVPLSLAIFQFLASAAPAP